MVTLEIGPVYVGSQERRIPHSLNARLYWAARYRWNKEWKTAVWEQVMVNRRKFGKLPYKRAKVVITLHTVQLLDLDNAYTCIKPLLDALKDKVLVDDNPNCLELEVKQQKVDHRKEEKVTMNIERIEDVQPNADNSRVRAA